MRPLARVLCWFAAFPWAAFFQLETPSDRVAVLLRGFAVILSPLAFTLAFLHNGAQIVGTAPYLYLLPAAVFCLDWFLIARSYTATRGAGALIVLRFGILLISAFMAMFTGLLSEGDNLVQRLHRVEDSVTLQGSAARDIAARREALLERIARNGQALANRSSIKLEALEARRLQELECKGESSVDKKTGILIQGGKCGRRAEAHKIEAENAEARLAQLDALQTENQKLAGQGAELDRQLDDLLKSNRSPAASMATLVRALNEADLGLWSSVVLKALVIIVMESLAMIFSELTVPPALRTAVEYSGEVDKRRLDVWRDAKVAEVARERSTRRTAVADGLAPLEVTLTAVASTSPGARRGSGNKTKESLG